LVESTKDSGVPEIPRKPGKRKVKAAVRIQYGVLPCAGAEASIAGERTTIFARVVILAAGAVNSAALLLASREEGVANRSDVVGRHFMNHNCSAVLAIDPRSVNDSVYQKTLGVNDFYLDDGRGGPPLGNIQLLGRVTGPAWHRTCSVDEVW